MDLIRQLKRKIDHLRLHTTNVGRANIDTLFWEAIDDELAPRLLFKVIKEKLSEEGIELTTQEEDHILQKIKQAKDNDYLIDTIALDQDHENNVPILSFDDRDADKLERYYRDAFQKFGSKIPDLTLESANSIYGLMKKTGKSQLSWAEKQKNRTRKEVRTGWQKPLDSLQLLIDICFEVAFNLNDDYSAEAEAEKDYVFHALIGLHASCCRTASEIHSLLYNGFADGANARWRSLHEHNVISLFLAMREPEISKRFLDYQYIDSFNAMRDYQSFCGRLGYPPYSEEEVKASRQAKDALVKKYGTRFERSYGWAADTLNKDYPKFKHIEQDVSLDHLRPFYKMASYSIHPSSKGIYFNLGQHPVEFSFLAGPSVYGLSDPGQLTAISLSQATINILATRPTIDQLLAIQVINMFTNRTINEFYEAHTIVENLSS